ncbi:MAG: hypothetical protein H7842_04095 [Gammaproteobacteria bacterium SHHR-1]|uniref:hypothetical protein n=1 Tax=Magnetovirga frankeli TaxID=947516 RepID=UPI001292DCB5|nr:hypothetical protein D5125_06525 [gamma proteobacterium SS-5]
MSESKLFNALREEDRQTSKGKKGGGPLRYVLIVGIVILLGFNLLFVDFGEDDGGQQPLPEPQIQPITPPPGQDAQPGQFTPDLGRQPIEQGSADEGNQARALIDDVRNRGNTADPEALFAQAGTFIQEGKLADAYLIYFYLAKQGHGPATLTLAEMADPAYYDPRTSFYEAPDFAQAHKWYLQAIMLGEDRAEAQLRDLKLRVKAAAASGDEKARRLLVGW